MSDYDQEVKAIQEHNKPILDEFRQWLKKASLGDSTIKKHLWNIDFFADYLVYYEPLEKLDNADAGDVYSFLADWYPSKASWASPNDVRSNMASFRKFYKFMLDSNRIDTEDESEVRNTLKRDKDEFLEAATFDDDGWW